MPKTVMPGQNVNMVAKPAKPEEKQRVIKVVLLHINNDGTPITI